MGRKLRASLTIGASLLFAASVGSTVLAAEEDVGSDVIDRYLDATKVQEAAMRGIQMEVDIDAKLPKLEKQGKLRALRFVSTVGRITYRTLGDFIGDKTVRNEVIARYLSAETEARDNGSLAINRDNYKFRFKSKTMDGGRQIYAFQLTPKKKRVGLFRGELRIDADTGMPVQESGELVKNPSIFLKKVEFVRDYEMQDGVSVPSHIESKVDTRLVGPAELSINFSNYTRPSQDAAPVVADTP